MDIKDIDSIIESQSKYFIQTKFSTIRVDGSTGLIPVLLHTASSRIIGVSQYHLAIEGLLDHNTSERNSFNSKTPAQNLVISEGKLWTVQLDKIKEQWKLNLNFNGVEEIQYFILMNQKLKLIDIITDSICMQKARSVYKLPYEQHLMIGKMYEVEKITNKNIMSDEFNEYPIVSSYARFRGIDFQNAVTEIQFQLKHDFTYLSEIEFVRLKYTKIVRDENSIENLKNIFDDFRNEIHGYSRFDTL
jgi:hypothetical protein